jgi:hypothetical protein
VRDPRWELGSDRAPTTVTLVGEEADMAGQATDRGGQIGEGVGLSADLLEKLHRELLQRADLDEGGRNIGGPISHGIDPFFSS